VNRAQRRCAQRQAPASVRWVAENYRCPDCLSENSHLAQDKYGIWHVNVHHDNTCPTYRRLLAQGLAS
jgi:hypothetical protein